MIFLIASAAFGAVVGALTSFAAAAAGAIVIAPWIALTSFAAGAATVGAIVTALTSFAGFCAVIGASVTALTSFAAAAVGAIAIALTSFVTGAAAVGATVTAFTSFAGVSAAIGAIAIALTSITAAVVGAIGIALTSFAAGAGTGAAAVVAAVTALTSFVVTTAGAIALALAILRKASLNRVWVGSIAARIQVQAVMGGNIVAGSSLTIAQSIKAKGAIPTIIHAATRAVDAATRNATIDAAVKVIANGLPAIPQSIGVIHEPCYNCGSKGHNGHKCTAQNHSIRT